MEFKGVLVSLYILNTDHASLILYNHPLVIAKAAQHQIAVTVITVQELFNAWVGRINDPSLVESLLDKRNEQLCHISNSY